MHIGGKPVRLSGQAVRSPWRFVVHVAAVALLVALPLVVTPWGSQAYGYPKALVLYALVAIMLVAWVAALIAGHAPSWTLTLPEIALWCFLLAVILSSVTSANLPLTIFGAPGRHEGLLTVGAYASLFFLGAHFFGNEHGLRTLALGAGAAALVVISYGLLQVFLPPLFEGELVQQQWYSGGVGFTRIFSTLGSPIVYGGYLCLIIPLMVGVGPAMVRWSRRVWLIGTLLGYVSVVVTMSRGAWVGTLAGFLVLMVLLGRAELRHRWRPLVGSAAGIALAASLLLMAIATPGQVAARASSALDLHEGSLAQRLYIWDHTLDLIRSRPMLGWGLETLRVVFPYDRPSLVKTFGLQPVIIDKAHNDLLHVAVSVGIPGALAYGAFWAGVLVAGIRVWQRTSSSARLLAAGWVAGLIGYLVQLQLSFSTVALAPLVWLIAGASAGWEVETRSR